MAVRLFEGRDHAAAYCRYRVTPCELIDTIVSYVEKKVQCVDDALFHDDL